MEEETDKTENKQDNKPWLFKKGQSGNPRGRPKGTISLKEYARQMLAGMTDEERQEFFNGIPKEIIWKMSEGNPKQDNELSGELKIDDGRIFLPTKNTLGSSTETGTGFDK